MHSERSSVGALLHQLNRAVAHQHSCPVPRTENADAFAIQKRLGHTSLAVTRMYVDLASKDVAEVHRRASPGDNLRVRRR